MAQADACVAARLADGQQLALLFVDCGVIGRIDGVWGYLVGDGVRDRLGARLRTEVLRTQDILGHPGRDQFAPFGVDIHQCPFGNPVIRMGTVFVRSLARGFRLSPLSEGPAVRGGHHWEPAPKFAVHLAEL